MESLFLLVLTGFIIGTFGTLIGAGGGFILVPLLIIFYPELGPETITAISIAVVAVNAISGTFAYAKSGRIDYKSGVIFALYTIPGSILGVLTVQYIPKSFFNAVFGILLILVAVFLIFKTQKGKLERENTGIQDGYKQQHLVDKTGINYRYSYKMSKGIAISIFVGFISPLLGIGGGIIHVPAMVHWLQFPVYIATATSHFILSVMATVSVIVHLIDGNYNDSNVIQMVVLLSIGVIPGAQMGAYFSHRIKSQNIIKILALCLIIVGLRISIKSF